MDRAINKSTGELVSAFEVFKNGSYQNLQKGEWISPKDSIYNWEELKEKGIEEEPVHFVREALINYKSGKNGWRDPHFSIYPGSLAKTIEESPTHKLLKNWLFNRLKNDDLEIRYSKGTKQHKYDNKLKLSQLNINWNDYEIEVTTKGTKKLRADILLPLKNKDIFLGNGIIFEIQLSSQTEDQTHERTIERALHGYSVVWLFEKDFNIEEDNIELQNNIVKINSFSEQMHFAKKGFIGKLKSVVEQQCRFLDEKINETNQCIELIELKEKESIKKIDNYFEEIYSKVLDKLNIREAILIKKIETLEQNPFKGLVDSYSQQLLSKKDECVNNIFNSYSQINKIFETMKKKLNYPITFGICPRCSQGYMTKKYSKTNNSYFYGCSNFPTCRHTISINEGDEDDTD